MVDLIPVIAELLQGIAPVEIQFPSVNDEFPVITVLETYNSSSLILDHEELLSEHSFQIDVWDNGSNRARCEAISIQVNAIMLNQGFYRTMAQSIEDASGLHRKIMQFDCVLDEKTNFIYRR